jgi:tripartite-type tricarboxylate transporter receptor subunit TctC
MSKKRVFVSFDFDNEKTLKDFIDDAKKRPEAIVYSSGGLYGATHLPVAIFEKATGIPKLRHLPTNGGGPAITALLGNNAQMSTQTTSATIQHVKAGKLRPLASFGGKRSKALPDVPTLKELGYDAEYYLWVGLFAPKGTPADAIAALSAALDKAADTADFRNVVSKLGQEYAYLNAKDFAAFWAADANRSEEAVRLIGKQG